MDPRRQEFGRTPPRRTWDPVSAGLPMNAARPQPVLPPEIPQFFAPAPGAPAYTPMLLGAAQVRFADAKKSVDETRDVVVVTRITDRAVPVDWTQAAEAGFALDDLGREPAAGATFADLPRAAQQAKHYPNWSKSFAAWLTREQVLESPEKPVAQRRLESG